MMSRYIQVLGLSVIALLLSMAGLAQNIRGKVTDSTGKAVPYASVNLINSDNNRIIGYAVTDAGGAYTLPIPVNSPLSNL
jgi:protocatechuate 3,4-dioxygenase beta subunit